MAMQPAIANYSGLQLPHDASSTLYIEGLPADASEREVAQIFRRYEGHGYQSVRMRPLESKSNPGTQIFLCFVEFDNAHQATIALYGLQGYRFDPKVDSSGLRISYAKSKGSRPPPPRPPPPLPAAPHADSRPPMYDDSYRSREAPHSRDERDRYEDDRRDSGRHERYDDRGGRYDDERQERYNDDRYDDSRGRYGREHNDRYRDDYEDSERGDDDYINRGAADYPLHSDDGLLG